MRPVARFECVRCGRGTDNLNDAGQYMCEPCLEELEWWADVFREAAEHRFPDEFAELTADGGGDE